MKNEKVIDTVRKILSKTESNGATAEEAANAAAFAQKMLTKHRLSMADINSYNPGEIGRYSSKIKGQRLSSWKVCLANVISEVNGCKIIKYSDGEIKGISFIGTKDDVTVVREMFDHIAERIETLTLMSCKGKGKNYSNSFRMGMFSTISGRLKEAAEEARSEANSSAIVKVDMRSGQVDKWVANLGLAKDNTTIQTKYNHIAVHAGMDAGKNVDLKPTKKIDTV